MWAWALRERGQARQGHGQGQGGSLFILFLRQSARPIPAAPSRETESREDLVVLWQRSQKGKCSPTHIPPCPCHQMTWPSPPFHQTRQNIDDPICRTRTNPPTRATRGQDPLRDPRSLLDQRSPRGSISRFCWIESSQLHPDTTLSTRVRMPRGMPQPFSLGPKGNPLLGPVSACPSGTRLPARFRLAHTSPNLDRGTQARIATSVVEHQRRTHSGTLALRIFGILWIRPSDMSQCPEPALVFPGFARPGNLLWAC